MANQQATNHRGQVRLNESFYPCTLHQQSQDPSPYAWPTPEELEVIVAWPRDWPNFQTGAGPKGTSRDGDEAQEDDDMANVMDFFLGGGEVVRPGSPNL